MKLKLKPRTYHEVRDSIEAAISCGYMRAHKHTDKPSEAHVVECIQHEVMNVLGEVVEFSAVKEGQR